jgi:hypothetical protein
MVAIMLPARAVPRLNPSAPPSSPGHRTDGIPDLAPPQDGVAVTAPAMPPERRAHGWCARSSAPPNRPTGRWIDRKCWKFAALRLCWYATPLYLQSLYVA